MLDVPDPAQYSRTCGSAITSGSSAAGAQITPCSSRRPDQYARSCSAKVSEIVAASSRPCSAKRSAALRPSNASSGRPIAEQNWSQ